MKQLRILQVFPSFNTGGVEEGALAISNALQNAGHKSFLASSGGKKAIIAEKQGAKHFTMTGLTKKNPFLSLSLVNQLSTIISSNNINLIHARSRWPAWIAYFAALKTNTPYMTTFHGAHKTQNSIKRFYNSIMVRTNNVISISDFLTEYIRATYPTTLSKYDTRIHTVYRGIDENKFDPGKISEDEKSKLRDLWGIKKGNKIIILPARMTRIKGHEVLIKALSKIDTTGVTALLVGSQPNDDPKYLQELYQLIKNLSLDGVIKVLPSTDKMPTAYSLADVVVFPSSRPEAFGRIVVESQAMGIPIVTSNIGAQATLVEHGISGWLFDNENASSLASQIEVVLNLPNSIREIYAKNMREHVLSSYTQEIMCTKTLGIYEQILRS